ncbi:MAG: DUF721 domain-containing protein [bacterium]
MRAKVFNSGRWQMQRERCHIADLAPPPGGGSAPIGRVISAVIKSFDKPGPDWLHDITSEWTKLAGETEARHARPGRCQDGTLTVFVDGAVWMNELRRYWQKDMLRKLQARFGEKTVRKLVLQPDPDLR